MSIRMIARVWDEVHLTNPSEVAVLLAMCDHADDAGRQCFPSVDRLAFKTNLSVDTVKRTLGALRKQKIIVEVAPASHHRPTEYRIDLDAAPTKSFDEWAATNGRDHKRTKKGVHGAPSESGGANDDEGVRITPAGGANHPGRGCESPQGGGANHAPLTVKEPSSEPSKNPFPESSDSGSDGQTDEPKATAAAGDDPGKGPSGAGGKPRRDTAAGFVEWWQAYPARMRESGTLTKGSRAVALDLWRQLSAVSQATAMAGLPGYVAERGDTPRDAERYLRHRLWRDYVDDAADPAPTPTVDPDDPVARIDAEIQRVRTSDDVRYAGSFGRQKRAEELERLAAEREVLLAHGTPDRGVAA